MFTNWTRFQTGAPTCTDWLPRWSFTRLTLFGMMDISSVGRVKPVEIDWTPIWGFPKREGYPPNRLSIRENPSRNGRFFGYPSDSGNLLWLVVWTPLKNISQLGWLFPIYGKIKNGNQTTNQFFFAPLSDGFPYHLDKLPRNESTINETCDGARRSFARTSPSRRLAQFLGPLPPGKPPFQVLWRRLTLEKPFGLKLLLW